MIAKGSITVLGTFVNEPFNEVLVPIGEVQVGVNAGSLRLSHPLDFDISPGTAVGGNPALDYNSMTAAPDPVIRVPFTTSGSLNMPASITATAPLRVLLTVSEWTADWPGGGCRDKYRDRWRKIREVYTGNWSDAGMLAVLVAEWGRDDVIRFFGFDLPAAGHPAVFEETIVFERRAMNPP